MHKFFSKFVVRCQTQSFGVIVFDCLHFEVYLNVKIPLYTAKNELLNKSNVAPIKRVLSATTYV